MRELYRELAERLLEVNRKQVKRWDGLKGEEFRKLSVEVLEDIIGIEGLLEGSGYSSGIVHKAGTVFHCAYYGELVSGEMSKMEEDKVLERVRRWVETDIVEDIRSTG